MLVSIFRYASKAPPLGFFFSEAMLFWSCCVFVWEPSSRSTLEYCQGVNTAGRRAVSLVTCQCTRCSATLAKIPLGILMEFDRLVLHIHLHGAALGVLL